MARRVQVDLSITDPANPAMRVPVGTEQRYLLGPGEGRWWLNYAVPVAILLMLLIFMLFSWTRPTAPPSTPPAAHPAARPPAAPKANKPQRQPIGAPPTRTPPTLTVNVPGLQEAAGAMKTLADKYSAAPPVQFPSQLDVNVHHPDESARRPLGDRPANSCADASREEKGRCEAWLRALGQQ